MRAVRDRHRSHPPRPDREDQTADGGQAEQQPEGEHLPGEQVFGTRGSPLVGDRRPGGSGRGAGHAQRGYGPHGAGGASRSWNPPPAPGRQARPGGWEGSGPPPGQRRVKTESRAARGSRSRHAGGKSPTRPAARTHRKRGRPEQGDADDQARDATRRGAWSTGQRYWPVLATVSMERPGSVPLLAGDERADVDDPLRPSCRRSGPSRPGWWCWAGPRSP